MFFSFLYTSNSYYNYLEILFAGTNNNQLHFSTTATCIKRASIVLPMEALLNFLHMAPAMNFSQCEKQTFFSLTESNGNSFPINNHIAMDNWNSVNVTPVPSNWKNNFTPTQQNFGGIGSYPRHNSGYSNQAGISSSYQPNLDPFPQCSKSRQIYHPEYASSSSSSGKDTSSLELPDR